MELNRKNIIKKINLFSFENNKEGMISLLCDILDSKDFLEHYDLILMIIDIAELYGYQEFFKKIISNKDNCDASYISNIVRRDLYRSKHNSEIYFNSGQLSLLAEMNQHNRLFISAPTSFGKTSLVLEHIAINTLKYDSIVFLAPTNALVEELYLKFLKLNKECNLNYHILTTPKKSEIRSIWILTPEKFLLLKEDYNKEFDLIIMDESYKIENTEEINKEDILNSRSSKYRKVMEYMAMSQSKIIFLSPYTYLKDQSMVRFIKKYQIEVVDRNINYVKKNIFDISDNVHYKQNFSNSNMNIRKKDSGVKKAIATLPYLKDNTIIYVMYPSEALKILPYFDNDYVNKINKNERFKKFYNHLKENYLFEGSNWYVIDALERGIGIYVSPMPRYIKKEIIYLFNNGLLKYLIVTTAFAEGVNSSAKNIIITNRVAGSNKKLSNLDILNLGGRAGRFGIHSKGNIYSAVSEISDVLHEISEVGVTIKNPNYEIIDEQKIRTDYEIDMIDNYLLNEHEKDLKEEVSKVQEQLKLSEEDLNIALSVSKRVKIILYIFFLSNINDLDIQNQRFQSIKNLLSSERTDIVKSITFIFDDLSKAKIPIVSDYGDISPYNKKGDFIWGTFYGIHSSGSIKDVLKSRKKYIIEQLKDVEKNLNLKFENMPGKQIEKYLSMCDKKWICDYLSNGKIDDTKLYNGAFKFISNIIEYRIPFYIGLYISVFKMFCKKNDIDYQFDFDIIEVSASLENKPIEQKYNDMLEFGIPLETIKKIEQYKQDNDLYKILDEYEQIMIEEYNYYFK